MPPRTILEIAQEAAERDGTLPAPTTLFGADATGRRLRHAARDTLRDLMRQSGWQGLSARHAAWAFSLVPGRAAYELPPDYARAIPGTAQRGGWPMGLAGPATPQTWAAWLHGGACAPSSMGWRIANGVLWIEPTPRTAELVVIGYVSAYPVVSALREGDYDLSTFPLQARAPVVPRDGWLDFSGQDVARAQTGTEGRYDAPSPGLDAATWAAEAEDVLKRLHPASRTGPLPQVRRPDFTADDDRPAIDDDHLLSLGMSYRLRRSLGLTYDEIAAEYEAEMQIALATDAGGARTIRLGREEDRPDVWPLGDGRWMVS